MCFKRDFGSYLGLLINIAYENFALTVTGNMNGHGDNNEKEDDYDKQDHDDDNEVKFGRG